MEERVERLREVIMLPEPERVASEIVDAAVQIHRDLGPGLLESVYQAVLAREVETRGLEVARNVTVPFEYHGVRYNQGLTVDLLVNRLVVVELKAAERLIPVNFRQIHTYLRLLDLPLGLLINFGAARLKDGLRRVLNDYRPAVDFASPTHRQTPRPS